MNSKNRIFSCNALIFIFLVITISCTKKEAVKTVPVLNISSITNITANTAATSGSITSNGGAQVTSRGICWSATENPTIADNISSNGTGDGSFEGSLTGLAPGTTYHVKAYGTNSAGTGYSGQIAFTTLAIAPGISTTALSSLTATSAMGGGNISTDGGSPITSRGVCWSTNQNPTISDSKTADGSGTGAFTSSITALTINVTYYIRAYATNSIGTSYGNQIVVTTVASLPTISTTDVSSVTAVNAISGGNISGDGGGTVTSRGVCWNTTINPTISSNKTTDGTGIGSFPSSISGLTRATQYYVRAYATNSAGTAYGSQVTFTTPVILPDVSTKIVAFNDSWASCEGEVLNDGGANVTARGICWGITQSPTIANPHSSDGTGQGAYVTYLTGLASNTTYYVRSYATNSVGINYGNSVSFTTQSVAQSSISDNEGNVYQTVTIGTQMWITENLKVTKYNDGTLIQRVTDNYEWANLATAGYCWYNNDSINYKDNYGAIYNWNAAHSGKLAPLGWHVPSDTEWTILSDFLGGISAAGDKLKEAGILHWVDPNSGTNETKFTVLPGGYRSGDSGAFFGLGNNCSLWSSTLDSGSNAWQRAITSYDTTDLRVISSNVHYGISVRCIKN